MAQASAHIVPLARDDSRNPTVVNDSFGSQNDQLGAIQATGRFRDGNRTHSGPKRAVTGLDGPPESGRSRSGVTAQLQFPNASETIFRRRDSTVAETRIG